MNTKQVNRKELLQLAFFKLVKQDKEKAALCLSDKMISQEHRGSNNVNFGDKEEELEIIRCIDQFLEDKHFGDMCDLNRLGHYLFKLNGKDVTINIESYEKN